MDSNNSKMPRERLFSKESHWGEQYIPLSTANRYEELTNLQDTQANDITLKIQEENNTSDIPNHDHQTKL
jgi:hypothetical protein